MSSLKKNSLGYFNYKNDLSKKFQAEKGLSYCFKYKKTSLGVFRQKKSFLGIFKYVKESFRNFYKHTWNFEDIFRSR